VVDLQVGEMCVVRTVNIKTRKQFYNFKVVIFFVAISTEICYEFLVQQLLRLYLGKIRSRPGTYFDRAWRTIFIMSSANGAHVSHLTKISP